MTRTASASESRIVTLTPSVNSMSAGSRPTSSQCCFRMPTLRVTTSSRPCRSTGRRIRDRPEGLLLAAAADHDRQVALDRQGSVAQVVELVVPAGRRRDGLAVEQVAARGHRLVQPVEPLPEPGPEVDAVRRVLRSIQAPPRPRIARPPEMWSSVGRAWPRAPGCGTCWRRRAGRPGASRWPSRTRSGSPSPRRSAGTDRRRSRTGGPTPTGARSPAGRCGGRRRCRTASRWPGSRGGRRS